LQGFWKQPVTSHSPFDSCSPEEISRTCCGLADLLRIQLAGGPDLLAASAGLLGYEPRPEEREEKQTTETLPGGGLGTGADTNETHEDEEVESPQIPFWRVEANKSFLPLDERELREQTPEPPAPGLLDHDAPPPSLSPLSSWKDLLPRLRQTATIQRPTRRVDIKRTIGLLSRGEFLTRLPRKSRRSWGQRVQVIVDRSDHLIPYWQDQDQVYAKLLKLFPRGSVETRTYLEGTNEPALLGGHRNRKEYRLPLADDLLLVLGDLGRLASSQQGEMFWKDLGRRRKESGCRSLVLLPTSSLAGFSAIRDWTCMAWEKDPYQGDQETNQDPLQRMLTLLSPAVRLEPGLLRDIRRFLGLDASLEARFWQRSLLSSWNAAAGTLNPQGKKSGKQNFEQEPEEVQRHALALLRRWRTDLPAEIMWEEIGELDESSQKLIDTNDFTRAQKFFAHYAAEAGKEESSFPDGFLPWFRRLRNRLPDRAWKDPVFGANFQRLWHEAYKHDPSAQPPPGYDPANIASSSKQPVRRIQITQHGSELVFRHAPDPAQPVPPCHSPLGTIETRNSEIVVAALKEQAEQDPAVFWKSGQPPSWASAWGRDHHGAWVEFLVPSEQGSLTQRLRWIPPGSFLMGSPENELGRYEGESPRHQVILSRGFWLAETACPQALWEAVMKDNPSHFQGAELPVERVSWNDCQTFFAKLEEVVPGLELTLPSEAQWEYACRAGTDTTFWWGDSITTAQANFNGNYPLEGGEKGEYRGKPIPVDALEPSPWGLYQMHGNVFEWCRDGMRNYQDRPETDPVGPLDSSQRAIRGGSWFSFARFVRAAYRLGLGPDLRSDDLGFRCCQVQAGAEPLEPSTSQAERRRERDRSGEAARVKILSAEKEIRLAWPGSGDLEICSDGGRLELDRLVPPPWARSTGRDAYGLWAEIEVEAKKGPPVRQRLRWIAPGRFLMGSPEGEAGRYPDEGPQHPVTLTQGFWLFDTTVTQELWLAVMGSNPSIFPGRCRPVENISWNDANEFLQRANQEVPGLNLELPSEAQWEYACRAGTRTAFWWGDTITTAQANFDGNLPLEGGEEGEFRGETLRVDALERSPWGLYQMHGNVFEWCRDGVRDYHNQAETDPVGLLQDGSRRAIRGGSWDSFASYVRAAYRFGCGPGLRDDFLGFRCCQVQDPGEGRAFTAKPSDDRPRSGTDPRRGRVME
jgi:formylglycine-generating enzyme required for sulfatase activity